MQACVSRKCTGDENDTPNCARRPDVAALELDPLSPSGLMGEAFSPVGDTSGLLSELLSPDEEPPPKFKSSPRLSPRRRKDTEAVVQGRCAAKPLGGRDGTARRPRRPTPKAGFGSQIAEVSTPSLVTDTTILNFLCRTILWM